LNAFYFRNPATLITRDRYSRRKHRWGLSCSIVRTCLQKREWAARDDRLFLLCVASQESFVGKRTRFVIAHIRRLNEHMRQVGRNELIRNALLNSGPSATPKANPSTDNGIPPVSRVLSRFAGCTLGLCRVRSLSRRCRQTMSARPSRNWRIVATRPKPR
jgi:hypothetical protein